ncbi:MAG: hypothetical protein J7507_15840 [Pseudoxanthomonas sp.]|nr:hypothetical protein [Pseudoxanthomonas sp.]
MPLAESTTAAAITFDAAVHRALARRLSDTPYPHNGAEPRDVAATGEARTADPVSEPAR